MTIKTKEIQDIIKLCLFLEHELDNRIPKGEFIRVQGVMLKFGWHPQRIMDHKDKIREMLDQLPREFHEKTGGGMSFLNACVDKDGVQWGEQRNVDELICLGLATKQVEFIMDRNMWDAFPGGVPYFVVKANV